MNSIIKLVVAGSTILAACGGGESADKPAATTDAPVTTDEPSTTTGDSAPVTAAEFDISEVEQSVVKIAAEGTFIDPEVGEQRNSAGVGSGSIISEDGIVVTNNHVVTGAALLRVTVPGIDKPVNAKVLGVSECSDLAVIQLEGDGYPTLEFRSDEVTAGLPVYAAGYPASDASTIDEVDYTLTRGIISATTANGETGWASIDSVLEHDARIRGGNSGGPLVDESGQIVGVNYAGIDASDQNYAITIADAEPIIERLTAGENVDSIGINGRAIYAPDQGAVGIWVSSVDSGSPAGTAGILPGDIVTRLEGLDLATDGTMSDYCDVIRTKGAEATMNIEVLRFATEEVYEGQLNGDPLELSFSFAQEYSDDLSEDASADTETYTDVVEVTDDSGSVRVEVPVEWSDVDGRPLQDFGPSLYASPNLESFNNTFDTPGVIIEATSNRTAADIETSLDEIDFSGSCTYVGREPYTDALYTGSLDFYSDCGGAGTVIVVLAVTPEDGSYMARLLIQAVEQRDLTAADHILATFIAAP